MQAKIFLVVFSNAHSILELMLCNQNIPKLLYQTLLSSHCNAWALKWSEHLKKTRKLSFKISLKRTINMKLKRTINQCKISYISENTFFCKNVFLYTINNISMVLQIIIIKSCCILKTMSRNSFPGPQPDSASYCQQQKKPISLSNPWQSVLIVMMDCSQSNGVFLSQPWQTPLREWESC